MEQFTVSDLFLGFVILGMMAILIFACKDEQKVIDFYTIKEKKKFVK